MNEITEEKRNQLNLDLRIILGLIELIDGDKKEYENYITNSLTEEDFLNQQQILVTQIKDRLLHILKG